MEKRKCPVCGKTFDASRSNMVYCSADCRIKARYIKLSKKSQEWETNEDRRKKLERMDKRNEKRRAKDDAQLQERAKQGEPFARMILLTREGKHNTLEYFIAFRDKVFETDEAFHTVSLVTVGDVDIYHPMFVELIAEMLKEGQKLTIRKSGYRRNE